jgi:hypothetical protein
LDRKTVEIGRRTKEKIAAVYYFRQRHLRHGSESSHSPMCVICSHICLYSIQHVQILKIWFGCAGFMWGW